VQNVKERSIKARLDTVGQAVHLDLDAVRHTTLLWERPTAIGRLEARSLCPSHWRLQLFDGERNRV
jgi:hypothetical protein